MGICGGKPDAKPAEAASPGRARSKTSLDRTVQGAIQIFNTKSGHHVLSYMSEHDMIEATDSIALARFLRANSDLDIVRVGDFLGEPDAFNKTVLQAYVHLVDIKGLGYDDALRQFLLSFRMPGEAQKIDRFMEAFAKEYTTVNPGTFQTEDTAYVLAFSLIMLNTDHFSAGIKEERRMTKKEFVSNNRAIDEALTEEYLGTMFERITQNEIAMHADGIQKDDKDSIMCYTNPQKHGRLSKLGANGVFYHMLNEHWFVLKDQMLYYLEAPPALGHKPKIDGMIPLSSSPNCQVQVSTAPHMLPQDSNAARSFVIYCTNHAGDRVKVKSLKITDRASNEDRETSAQGQHSEFVFVAEDAAVQKEWVAAIKKSIDHDHEVFTQEDKRRQTVVPILKPVEEAAVSKWLTLKLKQPGQVKLEKNLLEKYADEIQTVDGTPGCSADAVKKFLWAMQPGVLESLELVQEKENVDDVVANVLAHSKRAQEMRAKAADLDAVGLTEQADAIRAIANRQESVSS